jgi:probable HAF family extracellular repeat protein
MKEIFTMWFPSWLRALIPNSALPAARRIRRRSPCRKPAARRLHLESLEDRCCPSTYAITDLGTLGGASSWANAINNAGQVVGNAQTAGGSYHPFLYSSGVLTDLGILPGFANSGALAINDFGQVAVSAGSADTTVNGAFLWQSSTGLTPLGNLGSSYTVPHALNNATTAHAVQVVGEGQTPGDVVRHAWIWQNGVMTDLNTLIPPGSGWVLTKATGINDNQQIAGWGKINGQTHAFLWQVGGGVPTDLGVLPGGTESVANAINKTGQAAGASDGHAALWTSTGISDLGTRPKDVGSQALALNNLSQVQVVGYSLAASGVNQHAVLWQNGNVVDLTKQIGSNSGWAQLTYAYGVNDAGRIAGQGIGPSGNHAFLLTPTSGGKKLLAASTTAPGAETLRPAQARLPGTIPIYVFSTIDDPGGVNGSSAFGINSGGQITGSYFDGDFHAHGFLRSGGQYTTLDASPTAFATQANGINASGWIVGSYQDRDGFHGFLLAGGRYTPIDVPHGTFFSEAVGINAPGQIVGAYGDSNLVIHGYVLSGDRYTPIDHPNAGTGVIQGTYAFGINAAGSIVGSYVDANDGIHGFLLSGHRFFPIDEPNATTDSFAGTFVEGINDRGQIVGSYTDANFNTHGFLLSGGQYTTLDDPNAAFGTHATGIDDSGNIVGSYTDANFVEHAFLATLTHGHSLLAAAGNPDPGSAGSRSNALPATGPLALAGITRSLFRIETASPGAYSGRGFGRTPTGETSDDPPAPGTLGGNQARGQDLGHRGPVLSQVGRSAVKHTSRAGEILVTGDADIAAVVIMP